MSHPDNGRGTAPADRPSQIQTLGGGRIDSQDTTPPSTLIAEASACVLACSAIMCPWRCSTVRDMLDNYRSTS